ncbi:proline racemase family protein [Schinkia azotoformans]|uniref:proline racemase family protein n=1 Tax=Schinkia azotoformans TaxID=1454 RepID=UPI002DBF0F77|nr:proline racemase family protein [Schinkia azotoformans]MEC1770135.1 proline racemase family protein [Schinkia azotoformans]MED4365773.1 proline racemase family protein [Schinkia azotoformans]
MSNKYNQPLVIHTVDTHTGGDPTRIVVSGLPPVPGETMLEKKKYLIENLDHIRTSLILEPRGHKDMFGAILLEPTLPEADIGVVFMDTSGYLNMCGHGTIGVTTAIIERQIISYKSNDLVVLETPAGLVKVRATVNGNKVENVSIQNVPGFLWEPNIALEVPEVGNIMVDIAFGGNFYAFVDANELGLKITPNNNEKFSDIGMKILNHVNKTVKVEHPLEKNINKVDLIIFLDKSEEEGVDTQNVCVFGQGQVARSACGTGLSAQMAKENGKNLLNVGSTFVTESIINTKFYGKVVEEVRVGDIPAIIPEVNGNAYVMGVHQFILHPEDPLKYGFLLK